MKKQQQRSASEENGMVVIEDELLAAGFTSVPNLLLRQGELTAGAKLVYIGLLSYAWRERGPGPRRRRERVFPGQDTLAAELGLSRRSVVRHLKELAEKGFVNVIRRGQGKTNVYRVLPLTSVCQSVTSGNGRGDKMAQQAAPNRHIPSLEEEEVEEDEVSLGRLLATTMGHTSSPPERVERACRDTVKELLEAGEDAQELRRGIPLLPGQGDVVYGPGFLVARWPQLKAELVAQGEEREQAAAQRVVATAEEKKQAAADAAWAGIQALPAEKIRALRERARQSQLSVLAEVRDDHPVLRAGMVHLWQKRGGSIASSDVVHSAVG